MSILRPVLITASPSWDVQQHHQYSFNLVPLFAKVFPEVVFALKNQRLEAFAKVQHLYTDTNHYHIKFILW